MWYFFTFTLWQFIWTCGDFKQLHGNSRRFRFQSCHCDRSRIARKTRYKSGKTADGRSSGQAGMLSWWQKVICGPGEERVVGLQREWMDWALEDCDIERPNERVRVTLLIVNYLCPGAEAEPCFSELIRKRLWKKWKGRQRKRERESGASWQSWSENSNVLIWFVCFVSGEIAPTPLCPFF